jgi:hypothetical protein
MKLLPIVLILVLTACGSETGNARLKNVKPGNVQFFETYELNEMLDSWNAACNWAHDHDSIALKGSLTLDELSKRDLKRIVRVMYEGNVFAYAAEEHIPMIDSILAIPEVKNNFPKNLRFMWSYRLEETPDRKMMYALYAIKIPDSGKAIVDGRHIQSAEPAIATYNQMPVVRITMNDQGAHDWEVMTRKNIGRPIAITIDDHVLSCPVVNGAIAGGETEISGNFSKAEAEELAARINFGK